MESSTRTADPMAGKKPLGKKRQPMVTAYVSDTVWTEITQLIKEHGRTASRQNKIVGHGTTALRKESLLRSFRELAGLGYKLESVQNLQQRHVRALASHWETRGLSASTITNRLSCLRALCQWIGKPTMISASRDYVDDPRKATRRQATGIDKSWEAQGIDAGNMIGLVEAHDARVGAQLKLMLAFGLRRREAVMFRPLKADLGLAIRVRDGTKGGRERIVPITHPRQRELLDRLKSTVSHPNESIAHPDLDLKQAIRRLTYVLEKFGVTKNGLGVTAHMLRHQYLNGVYEDIAGVPAPIRQVSLTAEIDTVLHDIACARVAEDAGHSRLSISSAYIGARTTPSQDQKRMSALMAQDTLDIDERKELIRLAGKLGKLQQEEDTNANLA